MPPVWLALTIALSWLWAGVLPGPAIGAWAGVAGPMLVIAGAGLILAAAWEFRRAATSIIPHQQPRALISGGVFRWTRNPIYLADVLILTGAVLFRDAVLPLLLVPAFVWILRVRFILPEEQRLRAAFPSAFPAYAERTRRWI